jgi:EAL domain-containing protein (putative c-di-GMP-specific phosphodiesterase class I)
MDERPASGRRRRIEFGRRRVAPRACIIDAKVHIRTFLGDAFEELGFIADGCANAAQVGTALEETIPDLVVIVVSGQQASAPDVLSALAAAEFRGRVLLIGSRHSPALPAAQEHGEGLGLVMLPRLTTPFRSKDLIERLADLLPTGPRPSLPVDLTEALANNWLELWYQPKVDPHSLLICGAEAVIRLRHPTWGVVPPASFLPQPGDSHLTALADFVVTTAMAHWSYFSTEHSPIEIAINLPAIVLSDPAFVDRMRALLPDHPAFLRLVVEIDGAELIGDLKQARETARQLRHHNICISIDNIGIDWPSLQPLDGFPFAELKMDRTLIGGCAKDRLKRAACATVLDLARRFGAGAVAQGVEAREDFLTVREMGFDLVQGYLFGKPMEARKFARTQLRRGIPRFSEA